MNDQPFKYKLVLAYDGSRYSGWQVQPNATSIQTLVQAALSKTLNQKTFVVGSGRTDSGVHARGQVAHFTQSAEIDTGKVLYSLNGLLPADIRALELAPVPSDFHARYSAKGKIYRYHLRTSSLRDPFRRLYTYQLPCPIDEEILGKAARHFVGTHDFSSFANEAHRGSASRKPVKTLARLDILQEDGGLVLEFEGDGFLYKMVRNIVGALLDCARGKLDERKIPEIFEGKDRRLAPPTAPPHGLFLVSVKYEV